MKTKEIRELSIAEIDKAICDSHKELFNMKLRKQTGQLERPHTLRTVRKHIARLETIKNQKLQS